MAAQTASPSRRADQDQAASHDIDTPAVQQARQFIVHGLVVCACFEVGDGSYRPLIGDLRCCGHQQRQHKQRYPPEGVASGVATGPDP